MQCFKKSEEPEEIVSKVEKEKLESIKEDDTIVLAGADEPRESLQIPESNGYVRRKYVRKSRTSLSHQLQLSFSEGDNTFSSHGSQDTILKK